MLAAGNTLSHSGAFLFAAVGSPLLDVLRYGTEEQPFEKGQQLKGKENETISCLFPFSLF